MVVSVTLAEAALRVGLRSSSADDLGHLVGLKLFEQGLDPLPYRGSVGAVDLTTAQRFALAWNSPKTGRLWRSGQPQHRFWLSLLEAAK